MSGHKNTNREKRKRIVYMHGHTCRKYLDKTIQKAFCIIYLSKTKFYSQEISMLGPRRNPKTISYIIHWTQLHLPCLGKNAFNWFTNQFPHVIMRRKSNFQITAMCLNSPPHPFCFFIANPIPSIQTNVEVY